MFILYLFEIFQISIDKTKHLLLFFFPLKLSQQAAAYFAYDVAKVGNIIVTTKEKRNFFCFFARFTLPLHFVWNRRKLRGLMWRGCALLVS